MSNLIGAALYIGFWLAAVVGWVMNLIKIIGALGDPITGMFIFRCVGAICAPIGAVLGYF